MQRICICSTDSLQKSGKSTDSFMLLGKIYRFFAEIRRVKDRRFALNFEPENCIMSEQIYSDMARKTGKTTQTWRVFPANRSDMARKSGALLSAAGSPRARTGPHQARPRATRVRTARLARNPVHSQRFRTRNPVSTRNGYRVEITRNLWPRATDLRRYRLKSPPKMSETGWSV